jgi:hypothetical protein
VAPQTGEPNAVLAECLDELGWSPKALARKLNRVFGAGTVAESAPYHWRDAGSLPRSPLPMMAAYVLSQELGRNVSVAELWQGRVGDSSALVPADTDLARPWTAQGMEAIVEDWVMGGACRPSPVPRDLGCGTPHDRRPIPRRHRGTRSVHASNDVVARHRSARGPGRAASAHAPVT